MATDFSTTDNGASFTLVLQPGLTFTDGTPLDAGLLSEIVPTGGGQYIRMNQRRAPFDGIRARRAVMLAADPEGLNTIVHNGENEVPQTLFNEDSPYFTDVKLQQSNNEEAQALFDELAAAGATARTTQERLVAEIPGIWYTRAVPSVTYGTNVKGVELFTLGRSESG
ncbi:ABC transporter substrate-binding protein [Williamsia sp.]|uniref:ABC transporter substrate-binding protein n=1 Tax=Williamsia sp. TaxID=1872085 RepID=UPI002F91E54D